MEERKHSSKVICLFFPPLINNFGFQSGAEVKFFNPKSVLEVNRFLNSSVEKENNKIVLINYPGEEKQADSLQSELDKIGLKITDIILCNFINYDLMLEVQNKYLICPNCKKMFERSIVLGENKEFICPWDNEKYTLTKVNKFNENCLANYFKNSGKIVEKILGENRQESPSLHQLNINQEKEIFSGELWEKVLKVIDNF